MNKEEFEAKIEELKNDEKKLNDEMDIVFAVYKQFNELHSEYAKRIKAMYHTWELETRMLDITNISIVGSTDLETHDFTIDSVAVSGSSPNIVAAIAQSLDQIGDSDEQRNIMKMQLLFDMLKGRSFRQYMSHHISEIVSKTKE